MLSPASSPQENPLAKAPAMTSATILRPGSSSFQLESKRCADMSGPSPWPQRRSALNAPATTVFNLHMAFNHAARESRGNLDATEPK
jgi:hypothetical protein